MVPAQHPNGYEGALDPWLRRLWPALRERFPLPPGVPQVRGPSTVCHDMTWRGMAWHGTARMRTVRR